jgi:hypothetical protein
VRAAASSTRRRTYLVPRDPWPRQLGHVAELDAVGGGRDVEVEQPRERQGDEQEVAAEVGIGQHLHDPAVGCIAGCVGHRYGLRPLLVRGTGRAQQASVARSSGWPRCGDVTVWQAPQPAQNGWRRHRRPATTQAIVYASCLAVAVASIRAARLSAVTRTASPASSSYPCRPPVLDTRRHWRTSDSAWLTRRNRAVRGS